MLLVVGGVFDCGLVVSVTFQEVVESQVREAQGWRTRRSCAAVQLDSLGQLGELGVRRVERVHTLQVAHVQFYIVPISK